LAFFSWPYFGGQEEKRHGAGHPAPKFPTYAGNRAADISRFELTLDSATPLAR